jgi:FMN-dependent NADH-azoreductase
MDLLFVNACMREGSRTERLARAVLDRRKNRDVEVTELRLASFAVEPLDDRRLVRYGAGVAACDYSDEIFAFAKQFAVADEVLIAAPFWNFSVPAKLHCYLELVCSQGVTFDVDGPGTYASLCRARRLTYVTTIGGRIVSQADDHAFGYLKTLSDQFWHIPELTYVKAEGLDAEGADVEALLAAALHSVG